MRKWRTNRLSYSGYSHVLYARSTKIYFLEKEKRIYSNSPVRGQNTHLDSHAGANGGDPSVLRPVSFPSRMNRKFHFGIASPDINGSSRLHPKIRTPHDAYSEPYAACGTSRRTG